MHPGDFDGAAMEMPRYVSHKQVWALEIATVGEPLPDGSRELTFVEKGYAPIMAPAEMFSRYQPVSGDRYMVYQGGYRSFSPKAAFLDGYRLEADG